MEENSFVRTAYHMSDNMTTLQTLFVFTYTILKMCNSLAMHLIIVYFIVNGDYIWYHILSLSSRVTAYRDHRG